MTTLEKARNDLTSRLNTVNYVARYYPKAVAVQTENELDRFVDDSVTHKNATGLTFRMIENSASKLCIAMVRPFLTLKRRAGEKDPVRIYSKNEYSLAAHHVELVFNNVDCKKVLPLLEKVFRIQQGSKVA